MCSPSLCNYCYDFELHNNCEFNNRVVIERNKFNKIFDISNSHFNNDNIIPVSISYNDFLLKAKFDGISSNREIIYVFTTDCYSISCM